MNYSNIQTFIIFVTYFKQKYIGTAFGYKLWHETLKSLFFNKNTYIKPVGTYLYLKIRLLRHLEDWYVVASS